MSDSALFLSHASQLGLSPDEARDLALIKKAGRAHCLRFHPDRSRDDTDAARFIAARSAWEFLEDAAVREQEFVDSWTVSPEPPPDPEEGFSVYSGMEFQPAFLFLSARSLDPPSMKCALGIVTRVILEAVGDEFLLALYFSESSPWKDSSDFLTTRLLYKGEIIQDYVDLPAHSRSLMPGGEGVSVVWFSPFA